MKEERALIVRRYYSWKVLLTEVSYIQYPDADDPSVKTYTLPDAEILSAEAYCKRVLEDYGFRD